MDDKNIGEPGEPGNEADGGGNVSTITFPDFISAYQRCPHSTLHVCHIKVTCDTMIPTWTGKMGILNELEKSGIFD